MVNKSGESSLACERGPKLHPRWVDGTHWAYTNEQATRGSNKGHSAYRHNLAHCVGHGDCADYNAAVSRPLRSLMHRFNVLASDALAVARIDGKVWARLPGTLLTAYRQPDGTTVVVSEALITDWQCQTKQALTRLEGR
jgi:hypothetical protein